MGLKIQMSNATQLLNNSSFLQDDVDKPSQISSGAGVQSRCARPSAESMAWPRSPNTPGLPYARTIPSPAAFSFHNEGSAFALGTDTSPTTFCPFRVLTIAALLPRVTRTRWPQRMRPGGTERNRWLVFTPASGCDFLAQSRSTEGTSLEPDHVTDWCLGTPNTSSSWQKKKKYLKELRKKNYSAYFSWCHSPWLKNFLWQPQTPGQERGVLYKYPDQQVNIFIK